MKIEQLTCPVCRSSTVERIFVNGKYKKRFITGAGYINCTTCGFNGVLPLPTRWAITMCIFTFGTYLLFSILFSPLNLIAIACFYVLATTILDMVKTHNARKKLAN